MASLELPGSELLGFASPCHSPAAEENISICSLQVLYGSAMWPENAILPPRRGAGHTSFISLALLLVLSRQSQFWHLRSFEYLPLHI